MDNILSDYNTHKGGQFQPPRAPQAPCIAHGKLFIPEGESENLQEQSLAGALLGLLNRFRGASLPQWITCKSRS